MHETSKKTWLTSRNLILLLIGVGAIYLIVTTLVNNRLYNIELNTRNHIAEQQSLLSTIAEITDRNGADAVTESVIRDCALKERSEFEFLLGKLDQGLSHAQLGELDRLFGRCGSFYSERKSVMVARLAREITIYEDMVDQLSVITGEDMATEYSVAKWQALAQEEQNKSELHHSLVVHQDNIIKTLLSGSSADSPEISEILQQVTAVQQALIVSKKNATEIRSELTTL